MELQEIRDALDKLTAAVGEVPARRPEWAAFIEPGADHAELEMVKHTSNTISGYAAEHLAAIDVLVGGLQTTAPVYQGRPLEWSDVASLGRFREQLSEAVKGFNSAQAAAQLSRAAREVARDVRQIRDLEAHQQPAGRQGPAPIARAAVPHLVS